MNNNILRIDDISDSALKSSFTNIGVSQYCILYQSLVNQDHDSFSGTIDYNEISYRLDNDIAYEGGSKFADSDIVILDFEGPYTGAMVYGNGFIHTNGDGSIVTYEEIKQSLIDTIKFLKNRYPRKKWGYWGFPHLPEWICDIPNIIDYECEDPIRIDMANIEQKEFIKNHLYNNFKDLINECDVIGPDLFQRDLKDNDIYTNDKIDFTKAVINAEICSMLDPLNKKIKIAWITNMYFKELVLPPNALNGFELISYEDLYLESILPWINAGMDGFYIFVAMNYRIQQLTNPLSASTSEANSQKALRKSFNDNYLLGSGGAPEDDSYWTDVDNRDLFKTTYTEQLLMFCENILNKINSIGLKNKSPSESYKDIITVGDDLNGISSSLRYLQDGSGNPLPISVSNSSLNINFNGGAISNHNLIGAICKSYDIKKAAWSDSLDIIVGQPPNYILMSYFSPDSIDPIVVNSVTYQRTIINIKKPYIGYEYTNFPYYTYSDLYLFRSENPAPQIMYIFNPESGMTKLDDNNSNLNIGNYYTNSANNTYDLIRIEVWYIPQTPQYLYSIKLIKENIFG